MLVPAILNDNERVLGELDVPEDAVVIVWGGTVFLRHEMSDRHDARGRVRSFLSAAAYFTNRNLREVA